MVQDTRRRSQYYIAETTSREKQVNPRLDLTMLNVEAGRDNTRFVETTIKLDYNLARTMVIDNGKFTNVAYKQLISINNKQKKTMKACRLVCERALV